MITRMIAGWATHERRYRQVCLTLAGLLAVASVWLGLGVPLNSRLFETYPDNHPTIAAMHLVDRSLGGFLPLEICFEADQAQRFLEPDNFRRLAAFSRDALRNDEVLSARSYLDLFEAVHQHSRQDPEPLDDAGMDSQQSAGRIRRASRLAERMSELVGLRSFLTADGREARLLLRVRDVGTLHTLDLCRRLEADLQQVCTPDSGLKYRFTGDAYLNARAMDGFVRDMLSSLVGAAVVIFMVIGLLFRSPRIGLISVIPNLTPLVVTFGYLGLRGYELNAANVIVFSISLGVAVDNTIHFVSRFLENVRQGASVGESVRQVIQNTGRTMIFSTVLLVSGLSILAISEFVPTRRFAELTAVTMLAALCGDILLLPACLLAFSPERRKLVLTPEPARELQAR